MDHDDELTCCDCGHIRMNATQAAACCTMQGDECPDCQAAGRSTDRSSMRMICAWCRAVMNRGTGPDDPQVGHGMCSSCAALTDADRDRLVVAWARTREVYSVDK